MSAPKPSCHHLHSTGRRCGSPALRGEQFCFYHHPTLRPPTRTVPGTTTRTSFHLPPITDPEELQIALCEIGLLLASLQMAKANFAALPVYPPEESFTGESPSRTVRSTEVPDFSDLSGLLSVLGLQSTPTTPKH